MASERTRPQTLFIDGKDVNVNAAQALEINGILPTVLRRLLMPA